MIRLHTKAHAKINLTLDVLNRRPDGYHNLSTIMHAIPLSDDIDIYIGQGEGIHAKTNLTYIHSGSNLASKACKLFYSELATRGLISTQLPGVLIDIKKRIPVGAGLGGGSADAAAVLKVLNKHYNYPFTLDELSELGARLGADVPFCIRGGCALCEGVGDIITPKNTLPPCFIVLAKPIASISTAEIFGSYKMERKRMRPDTQGTLSALEKGDLGEISCRVYNVLQEIAEKDVKEISDIYNALILQGALGATMSGSGSAVFGLFEDEETAKASAANLRKRYRHAYFLEIET